MVINYFGRVYKDDDEVPEGLDTSYMMENDNFPGMRFDGSEIEQLGKYPNHSGKNPSMEFAHTEGQPFTELHIIKPVKKDEEIMVDYGDQYDYSHMGPGYTRYSS